MHQNGCELATAGKSAAGGKFPFNVGCWFVNNRGHCFPQTLSLATSVSGYLFSLQNAEAGAAARAEIL
jgi:hypothetical protein